jgi:H+-transporting ATPase
MFDPPRDDTKETIQKIQELGVQIKMITGDQVSVSRSLYLVLKSKSHCVNNNSFLSLDISYIIMYWIAELTLNL